MPLAHTIQAAAPPPSTAPPSKTTVPPPQLSEVEKAEKDLKEARARLKEATKKAQSTRPVGRPPGKPRNAGQSDRYDDDKKPYGRTEEEKEVTEYFRMGGELKIFQDVEKADPEKGIRKFGGVLMFPSRKTAFERPPPGVAEYKMEEQFPTNVIQRALSCAGLYRAAGTLRKTKESLSDHQIAIVKENAARAYSLMSSDEEFDDLLLFNDVATIGQLTDLIKKGGTRTVRYEVGRRDNQLQIYDGRLYPEEGKGIGNANRPFRNFILDNSSPSCTPPPDGGGVEMDPYENFDIDLVQALVRILASVLTEYGIPCDHLEEYVKNYEDWKKNIPNCKQRAICGIFNPCDVDSDEDPAPPAPKKRKTMAPLPGMLVEVSKGIRILVKPQPALGPSKSGKSPLGSAIFRLLTRIERALVDEACAVFQKHGFTIVALIMDGFPVRSSPKVVELAKRRGMSTVREYIEKIVLPEVNAPYQGKHVFVIKPFEYPREKTELDETPAQSFDFEHKLFGRLSAELVMKSLSTHQFRSYNEALTAIIPFAPRIARMIGGNKMALKSSGSFVRATGSDGVLPDPTTGKLVRPVEMLMRTVRIVGLDRLGREGSTGELRWVGGGAVILSDVLNLLGVAGHGLSEHYTSTLPVNHPLICDRYFSGRLPIAGVRNPWYKILTLEQSLEIVSPILSHIREILCCSIPGGDTFFLEALKRCLLSSRTEVCIILCGAEGGELKSGFMNWFGVRVLGIDTYLIRTGIADCAKQFQSEILGKAMILFEEMRPTTTSLADINAESSFKETTTGQFIKVEIKGVDEKIVDHNIASFFGISNHPETLRATAGVKRRIVPFEVSSAKKGDRQYLSKMFKLFDDPRSGAAFAKVLLEGDLVAPFDASAPMNPDMLIPTESFIASQFNGLYLREKALYIGVAWAVYKREEERIKSMMDAASADPVVDADSLPTGPYNLFITISDIVSNGNRFLHLKTDNEMTNEKIGHHLTVKKGAVRRMQVDGIRGRGLTFDENGLVANTDPSKPRVNLFDSALWKHAMMRIHASGM